MNEDALEFLAELEEQALRSKNDEIVPPGERACPICQNHMSVEVDYGVRIDICREHGIWLDRGELPEIIATIRSREKAGRANAILEAKKAGNHVGTQLGILALLLNHR